MGTLSGDLRDMGFEPTGRESPIDEDGELWSNGHEVVCDMTGVVLDGNHYPESDSRERVYEYRNSGRAKLAGGHVSSYDWGHDGDQFRY